MATGDIHVILDETNGADWSRWMPEYGTSVLTQELIHTMYNNIISTRRTPNRAFWAIPDIHEKYKEEEKPEIKRGNPWVQ